MTDKPHTDPQDEVPASPAPPSGAPPRQSTGGSLRWTPPSPERLQRMLPQYEVLEMIGHGGMAAVYQARQISLDRIVAIKILPPEAADDELDFIARFKNEARTMAKMLHPAIVAVFDFGETPEGQLFFVMEYVDGTDVHQMIHEQGRLRPEHALAITAHVCDALHYAHEQGIVHRDIKPANILLNQEGAVKVADFGLAKMNDPTNTLAVTQCGMTMGTPDYVAPEVLITGTVVDHRADLYAIGIMLYEMLTGKVPRGVFPMPSELVPGLDARFDAIVHRAVQANRDHRYQSSLEIRRDLDVILSTPVSKAGAAKAPVALAFPERAPSSARKPVPLGARTEFVRASAATQSAPLTGGKATAVSKKPPILPIAIGAAAVLGLGAFFLFRSANPEPQPITQILEMPKPDPVPAVPTPKATKPEPEPKPVVQTPVTPKPEPEPRPDPQPETEIVKSPPPEVEPVVTTAPLASPVNLLALADVQRDAVAGEWKLTSEGLVTAGGGHARVLLFNQEVPAEYDYEIEFTITSGWTRCTMLLPLPHSLLVWGMEGGKASFGPNLDGRKPEAPEQTEAIRTDLNLQLNQRYRCRVEVRKDSLRALLDGEEVLKWSGDIKRFDGVWHPSKGVAVPNRPGLHTYRASLTFHKAELRPPGWTEKLAAQAIPDAPVASSSAPPSADPRVAQLEAGFKTRYEADVQKPYLAAVAALNKSYIANGVARARADAQRRGSLKEVTLFDEVKARIERGEGVPEVDEPGTPESLISLRAIYRNALAKITAERDARAVPLYEMYIKALDAYVSELTMNNKLAEAHGVKELRDDVVSKKPGAASAVASTKPDPPKPATPVTTRMAETKPVGGGSRRDVAKWLVAKGGTGRIAFDNRTEELAREEHIPAGRFELVELNYSAKADHCTDEDFQRFNGQRDLRRIDVNTKGLSDAAFAFLAGNRELVWVSFSVENLGDGIFTHLAGARKISSLKINQSKRLTGKGMDQLACLPGLTAVSLENCTALTDDAFKALGRCGKLTHLHISGTSITDSGLAALTSASSLQHLELAGCRNLTEEGFGALRNLKSLTVLWAGGTSFGDSAAAAIAEMTSLREVNINGTGITDAGFAKLTALKNLKTIGIHNCKMLTGEGVAAFQKALPKCHVQR